MCTGRRPRNCSAIGAPIAALAVVAVLFIREKPLHTLSGDERAAQEQAAALPH